MNQKCDQCGETFAFGPQSLRAAQENGVEAVYVECPHCKKKIQTTKSMMATLGLKKPQYIYKQNGCSYCNHTGYKGRTAVHEIMYFDSTLKSALLSQNFDLDSLKKIAIENGMITISEACKKYVLDGVTSIDEYASPPAGV